MFVYNIDVLEKLKVAGYNTGKLRKEKILSEQTIQNIRNGEIIGIKSLDRICEILKCQPNYIIKHIRNQNISLDRDPEELDSLPPLE